MAVKRLFLPCALALALYIAVAGGEYDVIESRRAQAELQARRARLPEVRREIDSLRARIDSLQHDDAVLERFARERYGFIRDGELLYRILDPDADGPPGRGGATSRERAPGAGSPEDPGR